MGELSALKHNVSPRVFYEFLIVDRSGLLLFTCLFVSFFFLVLGHVLSDLKTCLTFQFNLNLLNDAFFFFKFYGMTLNVTLPNIYDF